MENRYFCKITDKYCNEVWNVTENEDSVSYENLKGENHLTSKENILINPKVQLAVGTNTYRLL